MGRHVSVRVLCIACLVVLAACQASSAVSPPANPASSVIAARPTVLAAPTWTPNPTLILSRSAAYFDGVSWSPDSSQIVTVLGSYWGREALVVSAVNLSGFQYLAGAKDIPELVSGTTVLNSAPAVSTLTPGTTPIVVTAAAPYLYDESSADSPQGYFSRPAWSPDNAQIAFGFVPSEMTASKWDLTSGLYLITPDGQNMRPVLMLPSSPELYDLQWSADGQQLRYITCAGGVPLKAYMVNANGTGNQLIREVASPDGGCPEQVKWAPDGQRIALYYYSDRDLLLLDANTGDMINLTGDDTERVVSFGWSRDSQRLAYSACTPDHVRCRLYTMNADGSSRHIQEEGLTYFDIAWSPDGQWFMLETSSGGSISGYILSAQRTTVR